MKTRNHGIWRGIAAMGLAAVITAACLGAGIGAASPTASEEAAVPTLASTLEAAPAVGPTAENLTEALLGTWSLRLDAWGGYPANQQAGTLIFREDNSFVMCQPLSQACGDSVSGDGDLQWTLSGSTIQLRSRCQGGATDITSYAGTIIENTISGTYKLCGTAGGE